MALGGGAVGVGHYGGDVGDVLRGLLRESALQMIRLTALHRLGGSYQVLRIMRPTEAVAMLAAI
jgi:hypothetical protein